MLDSLVNRCDRVQDGERPERFDLHDVRVVRHVDEYGRLEEIAFLADPAAAGPKLRALGHGVLDQGGQRRRSAFVGQRAHLDAVVEAVADDRCRGPFDKRIGVRVENTLVHKEAGW